jgi:hypothetical protein
MPRKALDFDVVREIGLALPEVEESTTYGAPSLKVHKRVLACPAIHRSAEPGTLVVKISFDERERLIKERPDIYYLKDHYVNYPSVLVRLFVIRNDELRELLGTAWRFVMEQAPQRAKKRRARRK